MLWDNAEVMGLEGGRWNWDQSGFSSLWIGSSETLCETSILQNHVPPKRGGFPSGCGVFPGVRITPWGRWGQVGDRGDPSECRWVGGISDAELLAGRAQLHSGTGRLQLCHFHALLCQNCRRLRALPAKIIKKKERELGAVLDLGLIL